MHAIVRQGDGKFYVSAVFGYYRDVTAAGGYEEYLQSITKPYWIVWDADGNRLVRWLAMTPDTKSLIPQILIVDSDRSNWTVDEQGVGCVDFLSRELLDLCDGEVIIPMRGAAESLNAAVAAAILMWEMCRGERG